MRGFGVKSRLAVLRGWGGHVRGAQTPFREREGFSVGFYLYIRGGQARRVDFDPGGARVPTPRRVCSGARAAAAAAARADPRGGGAAPARLPRASLRPAGQTAPDSPTWVLASAWTRAGRECSRLCRAGRKSCPTVLRLSDLSGKSLRAPGAWVTLPRTNGRDRHVRGGRG